MPYSDNMYSLYDDSDSDVNEDALSPTDGYFTSSSSAPSNVVPRVPNVTVVDPTLQQSETSAESKAREAGQERLLNSRTSHVQPQAPSAGDSSSYAASTFPSTRSYSTTPTHASSIAYTPSSYTATTYTSASRQPLPTFPSRGRTASLYSDAPPAYSPSAASPTSPTSPTSPLSPTNPSNQARTYNTFPPNMGIENERLLGRDPESMGSPDDEEPVRTPFWNRRIRRRLPPWLSWRMLILAAVLLIVSIGFLASSYRVFKGDENKNTIKPIKPQPPPEDIEEPPPVPEVPIAPPLEPLQATFCPDAQFRFPDQIMSVDFGKGDNFTFVEEQLSSSGDSQVKVGGQVNLRHIDDGGNPRIVLEIVTNDKDIELKSLLDNEGQRVKISVPKKATPATKNELSCVEMRATIWVPKGAQLQQLLISSVHLDVLMLNDLSIQVSDYARLSSIGGDVVSGTDKPRSYELAGLSFDKAPDFTFVPAVPTYSLDSRIIEVTTTTGKILGNWPLYDMLGLHSTSGNIDVSITPELALESDPKPAVLSMSSVSGFIHATEPIHELQIPMREYLVDIHSTSGAIHGLLAFSQGIELKSTASDIVVDLLPVLDQTTISSSNPAQLETVTTTGKTAVRILDPVWYGEKSATKNPKDVPFIPIGNRDPYDLFPPVHMPKDISTDLKEASARPFDCLQAIHKSTGANVGLRYPSSWVGDLEATTNRGLATVKGKAVQIVKSGGFPSMKLVAYKGQSGGASTISVKTLMGNVEAILGDV